MNFSRATADAVVLVVVLMVSAVTDLSVGKIFNVVTYPAIVVGLAASAIGTGPTTASALIGCLVGGVSLYLLFAVGWLGGGDVKLMAAVGALMGFPFVLYAMFYSIFAGGICAALALVWQGHGRAVLEDLLVLVRRVRYPGTYPDPIPTRGGSFPFGAAICVGTLTALALHWRQ